jgi:glycosyltransferase involved in cell wall biosynthesis
VAPKISVFLPSYNKGEYVLDAMRSVLSQTMPDWELWILENSNDGVTNKVVEEELERWNFNSRLGPASSVRYERLEGEETEYRRERLYITPWLLNVYYPEARGEYIFYLSDDDLIDPDCFEVMAAELDANPNYHVVYAGLRFTGVTQPGQNGPFPDTGIPAREVKAFSGTVDSQVDGGQVMHRKTCLDALVPPYFEEAPNTVVASHTDGVFLERLVGRFTFWPIDRYLITHRWTPESLWGKANPWQARA